MVSFIFYFIIMSSEILSQSSETALDQTIENSKKETVAL